MSKPIAYVFLSHSRDWECEVTLNPSEFEGLEDWYLAGEVCSLEELFQLMEDNDFDAEYFYELVEHLPHRLYNALNQGGYIL